MFTDENENKNEIRLHGVHLELLIRLTRHETIVKCHFRGVELGPYFPSRLSILWRVPLEISHPGDLSSRNILHAIRNEYGGGISIEISIELN